MKRQVQQTGIRKYFGADLIDLQSEPLKVLDSLFAEYGPCVIQGCEPSASEEGTYDIAPGLVALRTSAPEGAERVMAMPFGGARGVSLPVWLVPQQTIQERVYGDGKVKPVAHSYSAVVTASAPAKGVSSLQITAGGAPRLVDVLQDAAHRFVSDADKTKWDARVSSAQLAEALAGKFDKAGGEISGHVILPIDVALKGRMPNGDLIPLCFASADNTTRIGWGTHQTCINGTGDLLYDGQAVWHSGNFDPAVVFKNLVEIDSTNLNDDFVARSGNGVRRVGFYGQHSGMLVSFNPGNCSAAPLQILLDNYRNTSLKWRGGLNSVQADGPFRTIWDSGNLTPPPAIHWAQIIESDTPYRTSGDWIEYVQWRSNGYGMVCNIKPKVPVNSHAVQATILQTGGNVPSGLNVEVYDEIYNGEITVMLANANGAPVKGRFAIQVLGA